MSALILTTLGATFFPKFLRVEGDREKTRVEEIE